MEVGRKVGLRWKVIYLSKNRPRLCLKRWAPGTARRCFEPCIEDRLAGGLARRVEWFSTVPTRLSRRWGSNNRSDDSGMFRPEADRWTHSSSRITRREEPLSPVYHRKVRRSAGGSLRSKKNN